MKPRVKSEFGIHAFDASIWVECGTSEIRDALERYLFPPLPRIESLAAIPDILLSVHHDARGYEICVNGASRQLAETLDDTVLDAVKALDDAMIARLKLLRAVHSGAVMIEGRALLLPGSTHAGKSSLVSELLRRGASHFSDEYALIDSLGRVHPYPRPLLVRNGLPRQSVRLPEELGSSFAAAPATVGWILALNYTHGGQWDVRELSQSEAVMLLLRNTPHEMSQSPELVDFFRHAAANAACWEGTRGDAAEAATSVLRLINSK